MLFSHIHEDQGILASIAALTFVMEGIVTIRIFARLFMGTTVDRDISALSSDDLARSKKNQLIKFPMAEKANH